MTALIVFAFIVILAIACGLTWFVTQTRANKLWLADFNGYMKSTSKIRDYWQERLDEAQAENASLRARNEMLVGLVGADAGRAALSGACADDARWL